MARLLSIFLRFWDVECVASNGDANCNTNAYCHIYTNGNPHTHLHTRMYTGPVDAVGGSSNRSLRRFQR